MCSVSFWSLHIETIVDSCWTGICDTEMLAYNGRDKEVYHCDWKEIH